MSFFGKSSVPGGALSFKMEDLLKLAAFTVFMLLGSYIAGSVPLAFSFSEVSSVYLYLNRDKPLM